MDERDGRDGRDKIQTWLYTKFHQMNRLHKMPCNEFRALFCFVHDKCSAWNLTCNNKTDKSHMSMKCHHR